jgi:hypothetical protein
VSRNPVAAEPWASFAITAVFVFTLGIKEGRNSAADVVFGGTGQSNSGSAKLARRCSEANFAYRIIYLDVAKSLAYMVAIFASGLERACWEASPQVV